MRTKSWRWSPSTRPCPRLPSQPSSPPDSATGLARHSSGPRQEPPTCKHGRSRRVVESKTPGGRPRLPPAGRPRDRSRGLRLLAPQAARQEGLLRRLRHRRHGRLRPLLRSGAQAPGGDRVVSDLGERFPRLDPALADRSGAADDPHLDRRQQRRPRDHQPAADRRRPRRPLPRPPQQALLRKGNARLRAAAGGAEPLPQRLRRLRLLGRLARSRTRPRRLQTRLPPHLRDPPRRRQAGDDRPPPARSGAAAADRRRPRLAGGAGCDRLEPAARRLPHHSPEPPETLLPRLPLGRLGRNRLLLRLPGMGCAHRPLPPLLRQAFRDCRVGCRR